MDPLKGESTYRLEKFIRIRGFYTVNAANGLLIVDGVLSLVSFSSVQGLTCRDPMRPYHGMIVYHAEGQQEEIN